jgi:hypothetical protein
MSDRESHVDETARLTRVTSYPAFGTVGRRLTEH